MPYPLGVIVTLCSCAGLACDFEETWKESNFTTREFRVSLSGFLSVLSKSIILIVQARYPVQSVFPDYHYNCILLYFFLQNEFHSIGIKNCMKINKHLD